MRCLHRVGHYMPVALATGEARATTVKRFAFPAPAAAQERDHRLLVPPVADRLHVVAAGNRRRPRRRGSAPPAPPRCRRRRPRCRRRQAPAPDIRPTSAGVSARASRGCRRRAPRGRSSSGRRRCGRRARRRIATRRARAHAAPRRSPPSRRSPVTIASPRPPKTTRRTRSGCASASAAAIRAPIE